MMLGVHGTMQLESDQPETRAAPDGIQIAQFCWGLVASSSVAFWGLLERPILSYS